MFGKYNIIMNVIGIVILGRLHTRKRLEILRKHVYFVFRIRGALLGMRFDNIIFGVIIKLNARAEPSTYIHTNIHM